MLGSCFPVSIFASVLLAIPVISAVCCCVYPASNLACLILLGRFSRYIFYLRLFYFITFVLFAMFFFVTILCSNLEHFVIKWNKEIFGGADKCS